MLSKAVKFSILILATSLVLLAIISIVAYIKDVAEGKTVKAKLYKELTQFPEIQLYQEPWWDKGELHVWTQIKDKGTVIFWYTKNGAINGFLQYGDYFPDVNCVATTAEYSTFFNIAKDHEFKQLFPYEINTIKDIIDRYDQTIQIFSTLTKKPQQAFKFTSKFNDQLSNCTLYIGETDNAKN